jgi:ribosomal protein S18 acetylase RimI-like enzyme
MNTSQNSTKMNLIGIAPIKNEHGGNDMSKIIYEFYSEKDAVAVAALMKNNKFWVGKFDENLTGEKFVDYQCRKGAIFGIVGKKNDKVVSYVAAYKTGGQKVANKNQAFICALIIDQKYRMSVFSITDMFSLLIKELVNLGYNDLICEVAKDNYPSFYVMRKCGFVIIDERPTLYGDYVLHNYLPGVIKLADRIEYADSDVLPEIMQKLDKKNLYHAEEIIDNRFINIDCKAKKEEYSLYIDTLSGNIAGVHMRDANFKIWPCDRNLVAYTFDNFGIVSKTITVEFLCKEIVTKTKTFETEHFRVQIPDGVDKISFHVEGDVDKYTFFIDEMREQRRYKFEQANINLNDFCFEEKSAFLTCSMNENQVSLFKEMWPHICAPYIEGIFIPNYEKNISIGLIGDNKIIVTEKNEDYILTREYKSFGKRIEISTKAKMISKKQVQPMFQFALYDLSYNMDILLDDKSVANRKYDPEDGHYVTEEMIFLNFLQHEYSNQYFKQIDVSFDSLPRTIYRIKTDKLARCFCQLNYLGIEYNKKIFQGKREIDFGTIAIERIDS